MATPLLETKLYAPQPRPGVVSRARLNDRLRRGATARLTLVSAPAGFGKTTLLAELAAASEAGAGAVAWVSLDGGDNDAALFWTYVATALDRAVPGVGTAALALLDAPSGNLETVVATLLNDITASRVDVVLVLDDLHVITSAEIGASIAYLVEHLPPNAHVVIGTRADPTLPLGRLRVRREVVEIRAADLRFSPEEASAYLNGTMGLDLSDDDVRALGGRTEGWIAALQLAALSMEGRTDVTDFIADFAGDDRYIVDYLVEEVLHRQPDHVRDFLLETSILSRMTGPLCDAVTGDSDGSATLEALERGNLFLVPLDDRRRWYRYHHLFADTLQARLLDERSGDVAALHRRASEWYAAHDDRPEAVRHALAGKDFERAADLIEAAIPEVNRARQERTLRDWFEALPRELFQSRPALTVGFAGARMSTGQVEGIDELLAMAERALLSPDDTVVGSPAELRAIPSAIARYRAAQALVAGDLAGTARHARQSLDEAAADDHMGRGAGAALLGLAHWTRGELDAAYDSYAEGMASLERGGYLADTVGGSITLADIRVTQGRLGDAMRIYERGLARATKPGEGVLRGDGDMDIGLADILLERNDLEAAAWHVEASRALGEALGFPRHPWRSCMAIGRLRAAQGKLDDALTALDEAERRYVADFAPDVHPIAAHRARIWISQGRLSEAAAWARERGVSAADEPEYLREYEHTVLARLLVARGAQDGTVATLDEAVALTERLLAAAEAGGRFGSAIEILAVQASARHALGDTAGALAALTRAMELAEPEGWVRVFLDAGPRMHELLRVAAKDPGAPAYVTRLLGAFGDMREPLPTRQPLLEPLSERELDVLRLLQSDLDGPDIATELSVSINTLRTHTKNIYSKLGVTSRRAAVRRGLELELLARS